MIIDNEKDYFNFSNNNFLMLTTNSNNSLDLNKVLSNMNLNFNNLGELRNELTSTYGQFTLLNEVNSIGEITFAKNNNALFFTNFTI